MSNSISSFSNGVSRCCWSFLLASPSAAFLILWAATPGFAAIHSVQDSSQLETVQRSQIQSELNRELAISPDTQILQTVEPGAIASPTRPISETQLKPLTIARVTSVSGLSDVKPSDWAFQALQSLVERYGVIEGYPDGTFKGNRAMTRYEFAAGLNAALNRVNELIEAGMSDKVSRADVETLDKLQKEFSKELTTLRGRVDALEGRTARLEMFQFSTTTRLSGQAIFAVNTGLQNRNDDDPNTIFISRVRLTLNTSFTGRDRLQTQLQVSTGTPVLRSSQSPGVAFDAADYLADASSGLFYSPTTGNGFQLNRLSYTFPVGNDLSIVLFPRGFASDYVDFNTYSNKQFDNANNFSTTVLTSNILLFGRDFTSSGAAAIWRPKQGAFTFRAVYAAQDATVPNPTGLTTLPTGLGSITDAYGNPRSNRRGGLFGDPYVGIVEAEYSPSKRFAVRFQYANGEVGGRKYTALGANAEYAFSDNFAIFGRVGYSPNFFPNAFFGGAKPSYWQAGVALPNLFVKDALAGFSVAQPLIFQENEVQTNVTGTQTNYELFYNYPVSAAIRITPLIQIITDPLNNRERGAIFTGTLRTVFSF
jgi:Carbohydrate-selective porin, OprB family/S-layer homology domain